MRLKAVSVCHLDLYALPNPPQVKKELCGVFVKTNARELAPKGFSVHSLNEWSGDRAALTHTRVIALSITPSQCRTNVQQRTLLWHAITKEA